MLKKVLSICVVSALCYSLASGYEIVIDSTYYTDGRDDSKQVVYDPKTALMWQDNKDAKTVAKDWQGAMDYCQNLNLGGYSDWKLPGLEELKTIVDKSNSPAIKKEFKNTASHTHWSSTPVADSIYNAWYVRFSDGREGNYFKDEYDYFYVRCVRDSK
jgi:hypothetical protein